ncbi:unnamed protein product [Cylicostephanus goldi]|uniref:UTP--glucose-1-phosphate uridylyltransferase n=1 Tax=Cylicostephanus goldi TaxID=71465 RepID=A0A3P7MPM4_CYLGO|nr:unnamed protein product [Cylicostephanus goldi]
MEIAQLQNELPCHTYSFCCCILFIQISSSEADVFRKLYRQFLEETHFIDWNSWKFIADDVQRNHADLPEFESTREDVLDRLVVVKLNGGLGTTMGCDGPKSFIKVKENLSFLDIAKKQHEIFNKTHGSNVPLLLMNSFYTEEQTKRELGPDSFVQTFCQSQCPRIWADSLLPVEGRDIMFVSNIDNTGATLDLQIAQFACDENVDYIMECTEKTKNDIKGGTLIDIDGQLMHLEIPQVPPEHLNEFSSTRTFKIFNTNNIWVNLQAVKQRLDTISSEIIVNQKVGVHVGRNRFLPVKKSDDLLAISANLYTLTPEFSLRLNRNRPAPTVNLGKYFQNVS